MTLDERPPLTPGEVRYAWRWAAKKFGPRMTRTMRAWFNAFDSDDSRVAWLDAWLLLLRDAMLNDEGIVRILDAHPNLAARGYVETTPPDRPALLGVRIALAWLESFVWSIRAGETSYGMKHRAESWARDYYSRDELPNAYVANGEMIAALLYVGYPICRTRNGISVAAVASVAAPRAGIELRLCTSADKPALPRAVPRTAN